jgi:hypothetical protein
LAGQTWPGCAGHVLRGLDLAHQFAGVTADAVVVDLAQLDLAFGVDQEGAAQGQALFFDHDFEVARQRAGGVADQRVIDLLDGVRSVVPGLVREVRVGGDAEHFHAHVLERGVVGGQVFQLGGAHEGEVGRVEHQHRPLALEALVGDFDELAVLERGGLEGLDLGVDEGHGLSSF